MVSKLVGTKYELKIKVHIIMVSRKCNEHIGEHIVANLSEEERSTKSAGICCLSSTLTRSPTITYLIFALQD